ncbi:guanylate kinase [Paenibacillus luteus]|uniref:guanylate kinase n=1 Tax=Paenibacillus luteus TaxID=2545753 RepID=UPI0013761AD5|nr:guanylate kinase [Paenibacillus luteus]
MGKIFAFYGPSASGKSEIQKQLIHSGYPKIITATTRPPREHEQTGVHYIFMDALLFKASIEANKFIEWTEYNGYYYGTLKSSIDEVLNAAGIAHIVMDLAGVLALKQLYSNTIAIYVGANIETIGRRLEARGSAAEEILKRVKNAEELELSSEYRQYADVILWNHDGIDFQDTMRRIHELIEAER